MANKSYGISSINSNSSRAAQHAEAVLVNGYSIIPDVINDAGLANWRNKIDSTYQIQESEFGKDKLAKINEQDICRAPLLYDADFLNLATLPIVMDVMKQMLGDWFVLNLQNSIINLPGKIHHQTSWHRDLPYQNWVISKPIAINALIAIDEFSLETGATFALPFSHKNEQFPSQEFVEKNKVPVTMSAGSVVVFDAMMFHCAGNNSSRIVRRAVNNMYTIPILKPQYDFPRALGENTEFDNFEKQLLGYTSQVPIDDKHFRQNRFDKLMTNK